MYRGLFRKGGFVVGDSGVSGVPAVATEKTSVISVLDSIIENAHAIGASDIHFDPSALGLIVRMRVDGELREMQVLPNNAQCEMIARIKILTHLRTDEHQSAQDGRFCFVTAGGESINVRVSIMPTYHGENCVMRLLVEREGNATLERLGFSSAHCDILTRAIANPYGMILMTGPTGSGKTTTLYTLIKMLNTSATAIVTIEDPIEYSIHGINQIQLNRRTGVTFANGLRGIVRQDPNVIMVGEIRDAETAGIAVNAALTGHLLLSTLHTNDAASAIPRLLDLKIEGYLIASTLSVVVAQRLIRRICPLCKTQRTTTAADAASLRLLAPNEETLPHKICYGKGCDACNGTGYSGRIGIHEVIEVKGALRDAVLQCASADTLRAIALHEGMTPMTLDGFHKIASGDTTIEEVLRMRYE